MKKRNSNYIIIYTGSSTSNYRFANDEQLWDRYQPEDEFYGYLKCEVNGWKILNQPLFVIDLDYDDDDGFQYYLKLALKTFDKYGKNDPLIILACTNRSVWKNTFEQVIEIDTRGYSNEKWLELIHYCIAIT